MVIFRLCVPSLEDILMLQIDARTSLTRPACLLRKTEPLVMESCPLKESCPFFERAAGLLYQVFGRVSSKECPI